MMAKQKQGFTHEPGPLPPMTACAGGGHDGGHEHELFALAADGKWYCREHFFSGPGRTWPRKQRSRDGR